MSWGDMAGWTGTPIPLDAIDDALHTLDHSIGRLRDPAWEGLLRDAIPEGRGQPRWIWVLSGGGAKGDFEAGATLYLASRLEFFHPHAVCGTSVGAVNAVAVAEAGLSGFEKLKDAWLSLVVETDMYVDADWVEEVQRLESFRDFDIRSLLSSGGSGNIDLIDSWDRAAMVLGSLALPLIFGMLTADAVEQVERDIRAFLEILSRARSLFSLAPTRGRLQANLDTDALARAGTLIRLTTVALETGYRAHVTERGDMIISHPSGRRERVDLRHATRAEALLDGVMASAAIPGVFPPVVLDTRVPPRFRGDDRWERMTYVDGGVREVLPLDAAFDIIDHDWGWPEEPFIVAISASQAGDLNPPLQILERERPSFLEANFIDVASRGVEVAVDEVHAMELERDRWPSGPVIAHITPSFTVHDTTTIDPGLILISMSYGYMRAFDRLSPEALTGENYAYWLSDRITEARLECWRLENRARIGLGPRTTWVEAEILRIRDLKRRIHRFADSRVDRFGPSSVPPELSNVAVGNLNYTNDWWQQWERHKPGTGPDPRSGSTDPFTRFSTPWDSLLLDGGGEVPPEDPPPVL